MKIDTTAISGYAEMSAEEKLAALEAFEFETPAPKDTNEVTKLKTALSKANSDAAEWKRQFREKQTEAERAEAERKEREQAVEEELRTLRRDKTVGGYVCECLALGYSKELALRAAEAMADGDAATVFACQRENLEAQKQAFASEALDNLPKPSVGTPPSGKSAEEIELEKMKQYIGLK